MQTAIASNKHSAKDYAEAIDFRKGCQSYQEVSRIIMVFYSCKSRCCSSLKSTGTAELIKLSYLGTPYISSILEGENNLREYSS